MTTEFAEAMKARANIWLPAHGGTETPFIARNGRRLHYLYNPRSGRHAYLDTAADMFLTTDEAMKALNGF